MGAVHVFFKCPDLVQEIFTRTSSYLCLGSVLLLLNYELYAYIFVTYIFQVKKSDYYSSQFL